MPQGSISLERAASSAGGSSSGATTPPPADAPLVDRTPYQMYQFKSRDKQGYALDEHGNRIRKDVWRPPYYHGDVWKTMTPAAKKSAYNTWREDEMKRGFRLPVYEDLPRRTGSVLDADAMPATVHESLMEDAVDSGTPDDDNYSDVDGSDCPAMPVIPLQPSSHREKIVGSLLDCCCGSPCSMGRAHCDQEGF